MADKKPPPPEPTPEPAPPAKKGLPIKTLMVVGALMVAEAAAVFFVLGLMGGPKQGKADTEAHLQQDTSDELEEIEIVTDKFQNLTTGMVWLWDISLFVQVKNKNSERVEHTLKQRQAEIKEGVSQIVSRAQHAQLKEAERQTINRQFGAFLEKIVGTDAEGKPLIERVLIPKCRGFPSSP